MKLFYNNTVANRIAQIMDIKEIEDGESFRSIDSPEFYRGRYTRIGNALHYDPSRKLQPNDGYFEYIKDNNQDYTWTVQVIE
jgi:hypothetical protein